MKAGTKVRCVDAKEVGIPIKEGEVYTVKRFGSPAQCGAFLQGDVPIPGREREKCVVLEEEVGFYMASRFEEMAA